MPVRDRDGKEGNGVLSLFRRSFALINHDSSPTAAGPDQVSHYIAPLCGSAGCQSGLQYFNQNAKGGSVQKCCSSSPFARLEREVRESGCRSNRSGMIQLVPTKPRRR